MTNTLLQSTEKFLLEHGMDYTVNKMPAPHPVNRDQDVKGQFHLVRSTDNHVVSPKTVGSGYTTMTPRQMLVPIEPLIAEGWITPDKCHVINDGQHEILSFKIDGGMLPEKGTIVGEEWDHFFQLHNIHGGGAFYGALYCKRLACKNGATRIVRKGGGFRLRHSKTIEANYTEAMKTWKEIQDELAALGLRMKAWTDRQVSVVEAYNLIDEMYEIDRTLPVHNRTQNEIAFARIEFSNPSRGTYGKSFADLFNAITATNSHYQPRNSRETDAKYLASMFNNGGSRAKLEQRAIEVLALAL